MDLEAQRNAYRTAVGHGLQAWSGVENDMFLLFMQVSGTTGKKAILIYNSIVAFEARFKVLNELMLHDLENDLDRPVWIKLADRLIKFYKKRHDLAHFEIYTSIKGLPDGEQEESIAFHPMSTLGRALQNNQRTLTLAQIGERTLKFAALREAVVYFWSKAVMRSHQTELPVLVPDLIHHLRSLVDQNPEAQDDLPPPSDG